MATNSNLPEPVQQALCPTCDSQLLTLIEIVSPEDSEKATRETAGRSLGGAGIGALAGAPFGPGGAWLGATAGAFFGGASSPDYYAQMRCDSCGEEHEIGVNEDKVPPHLLPK
jgi:hypothetical protein